MFKFNPEAYAAGRDAYYKGALILDVLNRLNSTLAANEAAYNRPPEKVVGEAEREAERERVWQECTARDEADQSFIVGYADGLLAELRRAMHSVLPKR